MGLAAPGRVTRYLNTATAVFYWSTWEKSTVLYTTATLLLSHGDATDNETTHTEGPHAQGARCAGATLYAATGTSGNCYGSS